MNKRFLCGVILLFTTFHMHAQSKLIEQVFKAPTNEILSIPYAKYVLDNGLTLLISEDHSDPLVHVDVTYHVGSAREEAGYSGFAHFFEHMMFQGSKHVADDEHFKIISAAGGVLNGTTNRDRTNYYETVPKNYLETALWLEADRMGFLLDAVNQQKFEVQRSTVKNEKAQRYDNRPYGLLGEITDQCLYPVGHPYSWPTIGYVQDLDRVNVDDLKKFFLRWYSPNNATITIGGDVLTIEVLHMVEKYFGSIPRGPEVKKPTADYFNLDKDRYVSHEDNIRFPLLSVTFPSVPAYHDDEAALDVLADILGRGKSSLLYKNFVKSRKAVNASVSNGCEELAGEFEFSGTAFQDIRLSEIDSMLYATLDEFEKRGVTDEDLEKAKSAKYAEMVYRIGSVAGKVGVLSNYQVFLNSPGFIRNDLYRYEKLTKQDIMRVFQTYIKTQHALHLSFYPKGKKNLIARADNFKPRINAAPATQIARAEYDTLKPRPVKDNFKRDKKPKVGPAPELIVPVHVKNTTPQGLNVMTAFNNETPSMFMQVTVKCGQWHEPKGKEGIAYTLARMLNESTARQSAEQISNEVDKLGMRLAIYSTEEDIVISANMLKKNFMPSVGLVNIIMSQPKFDQEEFDKVKKQQLELIASQGVNATAMAGNTFNNLIYGSDHPYGTSSLGTITSIKSLTLQDVKDYFEKNFSALNTNVVISGDVGQDQMQHMQAMFGGIRRIELPSYTKPQAAPAPSKTKLYLVNKDNAPQSEIRVGYLALPYDAIGDYYKASIMNYMLGGAFNSHINMNLREKNAWTYGARSRFSGGHLPGPFVVSTSVRANATDSAVREIMKEIEAYRKHGMTKDELKFTKQSYTGAEILRYETNEQKASFMERVMDYDLFEGFVQTQADILKRMKTKEIKKLADEYLPVEKMDIVVVGDAKSLRDKLKALGYEVEEVTTYNTSQGK